MCYLFTLPSTKIIWHVTDVCLSMIDETKLTGKNQSTPIETCSSATFFTTKPTWKGLRLTLT